MKHPKNRLIRALLPALAAALLLAACGRTEPPPVVTTEAPAVTPAPIPSEAPETDAPGGSALLLVSFGAADCGAIEAEMAEAFPEYGVRCAGQDRVGETMEQAASDGTETLIVQPLCLTGGAAYSALYNVLAEHADPFETVCLCTPLLTAEEDYALVAEALANAVRGEDDGATAFCFIGRGSGDENDYVFGMLQQFFTEAGETHCFVGALGGEPDAQDVLELLRAGDYARVALCPLTVYGDAQIDEAMSGGAESWKTAFEAAGYDVVCRSGDLGESEPIRQLLVSHARDAIDWARAAGEN